MDDSENYFKKDGGGGVTHWWVTKQENELVDIWERSKFSVNTILQPMVKELHVYLRDPEPSTWRQVVLWASLSASEVLVIGRDKEAIRV